MHTEFDRDVVTNTLALYGVNSHSPAYYAIRFLARVGMVMAFVIAPHAIAFWIGGA